MKTYFLIVASTVAVLVGCNECGPAPTLAPVAAAQEPQEIFTDLPETPPAVEVPEAAQPTVAAPALDFSKLQGSIDNAVEAIQSAVANVTLPAVEVPRESAAPTETAPPVAESKSEPVPNLLLFSAPWCVNCPAMKKWIPLVETNGETVRVVDVSVDATVPFGLKTPVSVVPTWVRLNADGNEVERVPLNEQGFSHADLLRVLKLPPPRAVKNPRFADPPIRIQVPMQTPSVRRGSRRGF
jgi:thiol-disulfide isomerase/thioredoxin